MFFSGMIARHERKSVAESCDRSVTPAAKVYVQIDGFDDMSSTALSESAFN